MKTKKELNKEISRLKIYEYVINDLLCLHEYKVTSYYVGSVGEEKDLSTFIQERIDDTEFVFKV